MASKTLRISPYTSIVDNDRIANAIFCIVYFIWGTSINNFDFIPICNERFSLFVNSNRTIKSAVNRISSN